ncbi:hypothetical protein GCM10027200_40050 [Lentzea nigeriaca]
MRRRRVRDDGVADLDLNVLSRADGDKRWSNSAIAATSGSAVPQRHLGEALARYPSAVRPSPACAGTPPTGRNRNESEVDALDDECDNRGAHDDPAGPAGPTGSVHCGRSGAADHLGGEAEASARGDVGQVGAADRVRDGSAAAGLELRPEREQRA